VPAFGLDARSRKQEGGKAGSFLLSEQAVLRAPAVVPGAGAQRANPRIYFPPSRLPVDSCSIANFDAENSRASV